MSLKGGEGADSAPSDVLPTKNHADVTRVNAYATEILHKYNGVLLGIVTECFYFV